MPRILSAVSALPRHAVPQATIRDTVARIFDDRFPDLQRLLAVFDNSRIETRQFMRPLPWYMEPRSATERNKVYIEEGLDLVAEAAAAALERAGIGAGEIDHVVFVSSTGIATPSMDARLINRLGISSGASRVPVWGLGCAAGAAGLSRAFDYALGRPGAKVLVTALECCSLTFLADDVTKKNLVATSLFADGAAAAVVAGDTVAGRGPRITATSSHLFPETYHIMGWNVTEGGMELVLSPKLAALVKSELPRLAAEFATGPLSFYVTHPGGAKVVDAYRMALGLDEDDISLTEEVLRRHGNMSSVSVLVVLEKWLAGEGKHGGRGLLSAFGPGFSAELLLLEDD
jgi:alkylresorcinol/alkylpyrone synthase